MKDYFGYKNKICVVTGAASGIGKKTAELLIELDAEVYALDITKIELEGAKKFIEVDLSSKESIDLAMKQLPEHIDSFFGVAGLSGAKTNYYKTFTVNYIANKYITEEYLKNRMSAGGTIAYVTSTGGLYWDKYAHEFEKFTNAKTWDEMIEALHKQAKETTLGMMAYPLSKRALNYYMAKLAIELGPEKIRVNALLPGSTDTGMKKEFEVEAGGMDALVAETGTAKRLATPEEMAEPLIFLNSDMATFITGLPLIVDAGTNAMIKLKQKKDRMNMKVGSKIFNLEFIQKQLAKQLEPLQQEESNKPIEQTKNNAEEQPSTEKENNSEDTEIL
mgnify:FL=1